MSAENAWRITVEAVSDAVSDMEFWRGKAAEEFSTTVSSRIRSLPMPPAFRAEVEAEVEELRGMLGEAKRLLQSYSKDSIKLTDHQARKADTAAFLSRLEAKGESHE